jgi:hypothetical protein
VGEEARRYFILFTRWRKETLKQFMVENLDYFNHLYGALERSPGALRKFLLEHRMSAEFRPHAHAPRTEAFDRMVAITKSPMEDLFEGYLETDDDPLACNLLVYCAHLRQKIISEYPDNRHPFGNGIDTMISTLLGKLDFHRLGRVKVGKKQDTWWTRQPELFPKNGKSYAPAIREMLAKHVPNLAEKPYRESLGLLDDSLADTGHSVH